MLIQDRIKLIMKSQGATASEFADAIDIKRSNLSHVLSGRNKPSLDFLAKIISHYPNVNAAWLVTGETAEGSFRGGDQQQESEIKESVSSETSPVSQRDKKIIKVIAFYSDGTYETLGPSEQ